MTTRLTRRVGHGAGDDRVHGGDQPAWLLVPLTGPGWRLVFLVVGMIVMQAFVVAFNVVQVSYRQTICPDHLLGRMNATMRFVMWGTMPARWAARRCAGHRRRAAEHVVDHRDRAVAAGAVAGLLAARTGRLARHRV